MPTDLPRNRQLTPELRRRVGLPSADTRPYRWEFAALVVTLVAAPLALAHLWSMIVVSCLVAFAILPGLRWYERRELRQREGIFLHGEQARGVVVEVEPGGATGHGRTVRVEYLVDGTPTVGVHLNCPLGRRGIGPGEAVMVVFSKKAPTRCLVVDRAGPRTGQNGAYALPHEEA